jgi:GT2 family glycosyltransferase
MSSLAIVIVSWNVRDLLVRCLDAVNRSLADSAITFQIYVVDNASHDGTPELVRCHFPAVHLIEAGANIGFAAGNNRALRQIMRNPPDYLLLLNPDTEPVGDAIPQLVTWLAAHPEAVAVGPQLRYGDGSLQSSRRRFPTRLTLIWESTPLERLWPSNPWAHQYRMDDLPATQCRPVDWLVGAALLVRSSAVVAGGLLDERFFMYSEELEWQQRLQAGWGTAHRASTAIHPSAIFYLPEAVIIHHEGKSSEQAIAARYLNFNRSKMLLARIWFGWRFAALLRRLLWLSFGYELLIEGAKLAVGHRPELRRARIAVYQQVLREL